MKTLTRALGLLCLVAASGFGQGTILWNESVHGAFSSDFHSPTVMSQFQPGTNSVLGSTEVEPVGGNWSTHPDFFAIFVPSGLVVSQIFVGIDKQNVWAWIGEPSYLNEIAFVSNASNGSLLNQWGIASIAAGNYGMYFSNNDLQSFTSIAGYRLDFFVEAVPEPSPALLILAGLVWLGFARWRAAGLR